MATETATGRKGFTCYLTADLHERLTEVTGDFNLHPATVWNMQNRRDLRKNSLSAVIECILTDYDRLQREHETAKRRIQVLEIEVAKVQSLKAKAQRAHEMWSETTREVSAQLKALAAINSAS